MKVQHNVTWKAGHEKGVIGRGGGEGSSTGPAKIRDNKNLEKEGWETL